MFMFHVAYSLGLLTLTAGVFMYVWAIRTKGTGTGLAKVVGAIVAILAILSILCTIFSGVKAWRMNKMMRGHMYNYDMMKGGDKKNMPQDDNMMQNNGNMPMQNDNQRNEGINNI